MDDDKSAKVLRVLKNLDTSCDPTMEGIKDKENPARIDPNVSEESEMETANEVNSTAVSSDPGTLRTLREAMEGPEKDKWLPSIQEEI